MPTRPLLYVLADFAKLTLTLWAQFTTRPLQIHAAEAFRGVVNLVLFLRPGERVVVEPLRDRRGQILALDLIPALGQLRRLQNELTDAAKPLRVGHEPLDWSIEMLAQDLRGAIEQDGCLRFQVVTRLRLAQGIVLQRPSLPLGDVLDTIPGGDLGFEEDALSLSGVAASEAIDAACEVWNRTPGADPMHRAMARLVGEWRDAEGEPMGDEPDDSETVSATERAA